MKRWFVILLCSFSMMCVCGCTNEEVDKTVDFVTGAIENEYDTDIDEEQVREFVHKAKEVLEDEQTKELMKNLIDTVEQDK